MFKLGIIDPAKVAKTALLNAASAIGLALTTDVLLTELKEKKGEETTPVAGAIS
jgi:chaperonin GroEL